MAQGFGTMCAHSTCRVDVRSWIVGVGVIFCPVIKVFFEHSYLCIRARTPEVDVARRVPVALTHTLEHQAKAQSLPANHTIDGVLVARRGVADNLHVAHIAQNVLAVVNVLVAVKVSELQVAWFPGLGRKVRGVVCAVILVGFGLCLYDAIYAIAPYFTNAPALVPRSCGVITRWVGVFGNNGRCV